MKFNSTDVVIANTFVILLMQSKRFRLRFLSQTVIVKSMSLLATLRRFATLGKAKRTKNPKERKIETRLVR